jgi:HAD superfamily hydrolase (TIGR01509 family)
MLDPCLKRLGLFELFDNVWSCDDFGTTKADPEIYRMAADKIGRAVGDMIFVDDNPNAVSTAKRAGMISYGIYDQSSEGLIEEMREASDGYAYSLGELI